ncbi:MAG: DNA-binding FadR family transcriptional regulator [Myxococcota bacterium]
MPSSMVAQAHVRTAAARIERAIACKILRGEHPPGSDLPSVRALAVTFETTVPTVQRALERLATLGLVQATQGRGTRVLDPADGDLALLPVWFEAFADDPERCGRMLGDLLEVRRALAGYLFRTRREALAAALPMLAQPLQALATSTDLRSIVEADAALTGAVLDAVGNLALRAVLHTVSKLAVEVPHVAEALYADRAAHLEVVGAVATAFASGDPEPALAAMAAWDAASVARLKERLGSVG